MQPNYNFQKKYWERQKKRRVPQHPVIQAFVEPKLRYIDESLIKLNVSNQMSLLDIGCGNGFFTYYFEKLYQTFALDFSVSMLKKNSSSKKVCASAHKLPFVDQSFDILFCSNLLHHVENTDSIISEMKRVSRKYIILSEPNRDNPLMFLFGLLKKAERGTLKFSLQYMKNILIKAGLSPITSVQTGIILPNMTPEWLLPILKKFDANFSLGFYNIVISERQSN